MILKKVCYQGTWLKNLKATNQASLRVGDRFYNSKWGGKNNSTESYLEFLHLVQIYYCVSSLLNHTIFDSSFWMIESIANQRVY